MRAAVADLSIDIGGQVLRITTSIGVAQLDGDLGAAMHRADVALYRAKALGRNQVRSADDETASAAR